MHPTNGRGPDMERERRWLRRGERDDDHRFRFFEREDDRARFHAGMAGGYPGEREYRPDDWIHQRACALVRDDGRIDTSRIDISVHDGEITLHGSVDDRRSKRLVEDLVEHVPGVRDVHNRLRIHHFEENIEHLNSFLRGELSAVEAYRMAVHRLDRDSPARRELVRCMLSSSSGP